MAGGSKRAHLKSAYEVALERLGEGGIRPPNSDAVDDSVRAEIAAVRRKAEADLAQLEILHRERVKKAADPDEARTAQDDYAADRRRIEEARDRRLRQLREGT